MKDKILKLKQEHPDWGRYKIAKALKCNVKTVRYHLDESYRQKKQTRNNQSMRERLHGFKERAVEMMGGKCCKCGYDKCLGALDFHHTNPDTKDLGIREIRDWDILVKELAKCILVCSNCHREIHYSQECAPCGK